MNNVIKFKEKFVKLIAVCETCETTYSITINNKLYNKFDCGDRKCICQFCGSTDMWFSKEEL